MKLTKIVANISMKFSLGKQEDVESNNITTDLHLTCLSGLTKISDLQQYSAK